MSRARSGTVRWPGERNIGSSDVDRIRAEPGVSPAETFRGHIQASSSAPAGGAPQGMGRVAPFGRVGTPFDGVLVSTKILSICFKSKTYEYNSDRCH